MFESKKLNFYKYWSLLDFASKPLLPVSYYEAVSETEKLVLPSSKYRMIADVPVGVFLSGGYDSTLVKALIQTSSTERLKIFTIGFPYGINESPYARKIANILGTDHTEYSCTYKDARDIIPDLPYYYDEPLADISAIPTILVSRLARESVKVALSADGGDELFAGYSHYGVFSKRINQVYAVPKILRPIVSASACFFSNILPDKYFHQKHKLKGIGELIDLENSKILIELIYFARTLSPLFNKELFVNIENQKSKVYSTDYSKVIDLRNSILHLDYMVHLRDCLLVKVDRGSMSASLEAREPLLDHRLAEFAMQLPFEYKYNGKTYKRILRDITHKWVDKKIMDRPKIGFDLPVFEWLKTDLSFLIDEYLSPQKIKESGYFNEVTVSRLIQQFKTNTLLYKLIIWRLLMFQMWYKTWMK